MLLAGSAIIFSHVIAHHKDNCSDKTLCGVDIVQGEAKISEAAV